MPKQILLVKEKIDYLELLKELASEAHKAVQLLGKDFAWLQFARKGINGYTFIENRERQFQILEKVAFKTSKNYQSYPLGVNIDLLSYLVNTTIRDEIFTHALKPHPQLNAVEKEYLNKQLIVPIHENYFIPRHPWFFTTEFTKQSWRAKDLTTGQLFKVKHSRDQNHDFYEIF